MNYILPCLSSSIPERLPLTITDNANLLKIIGSAAKAPSGHNTQPWKFIVSDSAVEIHPDFNMALPAVDGNNRELYISLGCAAENLCISANEMGFHTIFSIERTVQKTSFIRIRLSKGAEIKDPLSEQIERSQTNRSYYKHEIIPTEIIEQLKKNRTDKRIKVHLFHKNSAGFFILRDLVEEGNVVQMKDAAFKKELLGWIRFNKKDEMTFQDGLSYRVMGMPSSPAIIGKQIVKSFLKPDKQNRSDLPKINSSSHLALFTVRNNDPENWILLGRRLQRFLLETTKYGISHAWLNQPCEVEDVVIKLQLQMHLYAEYPALLLRIGYADPMPYSPRKDLMSIISWN